LEAGKKVCVCVCERERERERERKEERKRGRVKERERERERESSIGCRSIGSRRKRVSERVSELVCVCMCG